MKNGHNNGHHRGAEERRNWRRRALAVAGGIAAVLFLVFYTVGWGLLLVRLIHYGHGFEYGNVPPLQKFTPLQMLAMLITVVFCAPIIVAAGVINRVRKSRRFRSWVERAGGGRSSREEVSGVAKHGIHHEPGSEG